MGSAEPTSFGELLRQFRTAAGLTQEQVAERAGVSTRGVQDLERGLRRAPHSETARRLATALGLTGRDLRTFEAAGRPGAQASSYGPTRSPSQHVLTPSPAFGLSPLGRLRTASPFVGRSHELEFLQAEYDAAAAGEGGRLIFVSGEPGVGKTRLAREAGNYARGGRFLEGHYLRDGTAPYGPWVEVLRAGLHELGREELAELVGPYGPELAQIMPELGDRVSSVPPPPPGGQSPEEQRRRLYDGIAGLLVRLSEHRPLVVLLDDVQWAPGISLLAHVARRLAESRVLLLAGYREQEFKEQPTLVRDWAELHRARLSTQLVLAPLTEEQTGELVANYLGDGPAAQLGPPIYRKTHGNAFFIEEVLRSLTETGAVRATPTGWDVADPTRVTIPESVRLAVEERVRRLGETAHAILTQAAVLGQEFAFAPLRAQTDCPEDDLIEALDRSVAARLLVDRSGDGEERFAFLDDQIQEVLYAGIPPVRRRRYHLRAGRAIEEVYAHRLEAQLEELARHFAEGNDAARAADYATRAAEKNVRLYNWQRARRLYERALDALACLPETPETLGRRVDTILQLVSVAYVIDDPEQNLARLAQAETLAMALPDPDGPGGDRGRLARVRHWMARILYNRNDLPAAKQYAEQALAWAHTSGDDQFALLASGVIGRVLLSQGYPGLVITLLAPAIGPLEERGSAWDWGIMLTYLAMARAATGDYAGGLADGQRVLARARAANDARRLALSYLHLAVVYLLGGDLTQALEASRAGARAAENSGDRFYAHICLGWRAWAESRLRQHEAARASLAAFKALRQSLGGRLTYSDWFAAMEAEMALNAGQLDQACALAEQAVAQAREVGGIFAEGLAHRVWAPALAGPNQAQRDEAEEHLAAALRCFDEGDHRLETARTHVAWGLLCQAQDDLAGAREHLELAAAQFEASRLTDELDRTRRLLQGVAP